MGEWAEPERWLSGSPTIERVDRVATEDKARRRRVACGFRTVSQGRLLQWCQRWWRVRRRSPPGRPCSALQVVPFSAIYSPYTPSHPSPSYLSLPLLTWPSSSAASSSFFVHFPTTSTPPDCPVLPANSQPLHP